jgi:peptide/nickel transport system permease protein
MSVGEETTLASGYPLPVPSADLPQSPRRPWRRVASLIGKSRPGLVLAAVFFACLIAAALQPAWLTSGDPLEANARMAFRAPSEAHWLGTDENGRDLFTRLVHGVRPSLLVGLAATAIGVGAGVAVGLLAGLGHRVVDGLIMRGVDVLLAFPDLLFALLIITFWGQGTFNTIVAVGVASVPRYARMVRAQAHMVRHAGYVEAARTLGLSTPVLVCRHILPNAVKPVLVLSIIGIGGKIAAGASLSFLGFGAPPPSPEWGAMLSAGRNFLGNAWWLTAAPAIAITLTVLALTALGREIVRRTEGRAP